MESITFLIEEEHKKILQIFSILKASQDNDDFLNFKWMIEKHIFMEDKAILELIKDSSAEYQETIRRIKTDHEKLLDIIGDKETSLAQFEGFWKNHENFEEDLFYPKLDQELNEKQTQIIIERLKTVI